MTYAPSTVIPAPMPGCWTPDWGISTYAILASGPSSASFEYPNRAAYFPILVPCMSVIRRFWWVNGTTVNASYVIDAGLYADAGYKPGSRLISTGNTAQGTASQVQFVDVTDTTIGPGRYWLALASSSNVATFFRGTTNGASDGSYRFQQDDARPLPATATPVASSTGRLYLFGFATTASP